MAKTLDKAADMKPYVERALKDEDLRDNVLAAFAAAREVYNDLLRDRGAVGIVSRVATDDDIQENLRRAVDELRQAADRVRGRDQHTFRNTTLLLGGIAAGLLFNPMTGEATRNWLKEKVFGSTDDFTYTGDSSSTNMSTAPPPTTPV